MLGFLHREFPIFLGRYSVSATKYYVDNRIDGEHYENSPSVEIEDTIQENGVEEVVSTVDREKLQYFVAGPIRRGAGNAEDGEDARGEDSNF